MIAPFNVNAGNALSYLLDDGNYLYVNNSDWMDRLGHNAYNMLKVCTLDFDPITKEDIRNISQTLLLELITDSAYNDDIENLIDSQYVTVVKSVIGLIGLSSSSIDNPSLVGETNNILSNTQSYNS